MSVAPSEVYILRIAGHTAGDQTQPVAYVSAPASVAPLAYLGTFACRRIAAIPRATGARLQPLAHAASGGAIGVTIVFDDTDPRVYGLQDATIDPVMGASGDAVRLVEVLRPDTTTLKLTEAPQGVSVGDRLFIGLEAVAVSAISGTSLTVSRGRLDTVALEHPAVWPGPVVYHQLPDVVGARCEIARCLPTATSRDDEEVIYRGIVQSVSEPRSGMMELSIGPMQRLFQGGANNYARRWQPPRLGLLANYGEQTIGLRSDAFAAFGVVLGNSGDTTTEHWSADWVHWRVYAGTKWMVLRLTTAPILGGRLYYLADASQAPLQMGEGDRIYSVGRAMAELFEPGESYEVTAIEYAHVWQGDARRLSTVMLDLFGADADLPLGGSLRMAAADYDAASFVALDRALDVARLESPLARTWDSVAGEPVFVLPPFERGAAIIRLLEEQILKPLFVALGTDNIGRIRLIDHRNVFVPIGTITELDLRTPGGAAPRIEPKRDRDTIFRQATFTAETAEGTDEHVVTSDIASSIYATGKELKFELSVLGAHIEAMARRTEALMASYELAQLEVTVTVSGSIQASQGEVVLLSMPFLPGRNGQRGGDNQRMLVLQRDEIAAGVQRVRGLLLGTDKGALVSLGARTVSTSGGVLTVDTAGNAFSGLAVSTYWVSSDKLLVYDQEGELRSATVAPVTASGASTVTVTLPVTVATTDRVRLANWDDTPARRWGWLADALGRLGADDDAGFVFA